MNTSPKRVEKVREHQQMDPKLEALTDYLDLTDLYFEASKIRSVYRMQALAALREQSLIRLLTKILNREPTVDEIALVQDRRISNGHM